ncbi:hypothetical protein GCM10008965_28550 [Methylorubrum aminovorans]|jgi:hypothetical protein|uniref:Uncharacterized protein n=7 Tax=Methylobacteriaceae TaxID=119045 RepID=A0A160PIE8_9HYPH|nr:hypothetical protein AKJ13_02040 [Methylobacterium sp. ARG-1]OAH23264.1 hypothetical protein AX289_21870 [Methylorubrum populi]BAU92696.1 hypothetical protein MPPM_4091 [Methylorubrum populi]GLS57081.1 hypothetical protein GCM10007886_52670 [Methylobacterium gregans]GMA74636.1 hypothetical protein GCM10025880_10530 [Methylorubrum aminovorans]
MPIGISRRLDHVRSEEFWDRVMHEAYEILPAQGSMSVADIMVRLRMTTLKGGRLVKEALSEGMPRKKIEISVEYERYFQRVGKDAYARLPGWDGALGKRTRAG